jgi:hypothetical protein
MKSFKNWKQLKKIKNLAKKADLDVSKYNDSEILKGFETEQEHQRDKETDIVKGDETKIVKILLAHLKEDPEYYKKLTKAKL